MRVIQALKLIEAGREQTYLIRVYKSEDGKVLSYQVLDDLPIGRTSKYYNEYLIARSNMALNHLI